MTQNNALWDDRKNIFGPDCTFATMWKIGANGFNLMLKMEEKFEMRLHDTSQRNVEDMNRDWY